MTSRPGDVVSGDNSTAGTSDTMSSEKSTRRLMSNSVASACRNFSACGHITWLIAVRDRRKQADEAHELATCQRCRLLADAARGTNLKQIFPLPLRHPAQGELPLRLEHELFHWCVGQIECPEDFPALEVTIGDIQIVWPHGRQHGADNLE